MPITDHFRKAVKSGKVRSIRIMMKDSMLVDPSFVEFGEMRRETSKMKGLYDQHDGRQLSYDETTWDDKYMNELMVQIVGNFSEERIEHLQRVVRKLRPVSKDRTIQVKHEPRKTTSTANTNRKRSSENEADSSLKVVGGLVIGAVAGGAVASAISASVIGGVTIGAVAGAVTASVITNGDKNE